jgi:hypothetical protein
MQALDASETMTHDVATQNHDVNLPSGADRRENNRDVHCAELL